MQLLAEGLLLAVAPWTEWERRCTQGRRLLEAGCPLVSVFWDEYKIVNTAWDTHFDHFTRLGDELLPAFDSAVSSLLTDLAERGHLPQAAQEPVHVAPSFPGLVPVQGELSQAEERVSHSEHQASGRSSPDASAAKKPRPLPVTRCWQTYVGTVAPWVSHTTWRFASSRASSCEPGSARRGATAVPAARRLVQAESRVPDRSRPARPGIRSTG